MEHFYSDDDILRWKRVNCSAIDLHKNKLTTVLSSQAMDFHLSNLAGSYYMLGMALIAQRDYTDSRLAFRASIETRCLMYERFEKGLGRALEAGHFQAMLLSLVVNDDSLTQRIVSQYRAEIGTADAIYLGSALKFIITKDIENAKRVIGGNRPSFESQFSGYADCLSAIIDKDLSGFASSIDWASNNWVRWASKKAKGLPDSVCFIQGVGLIRLAERMVGANISIANPFIPSDLLR